jgi:excinuclease ABC subunit A
VLEKRKSFDGITVKNAREHNLKGIDVQIPRNKITVFTGLSGSGKSTLAFDTIYAEGQRRYIESLSAYARNFLVQLKKPAVDSIHGLSPSIAIDQKTISTNPRSTVGTVTEIYDYLRLLFSRVGIPNCPVHKIPVTSQSPEQIVEEVMSLKQNTKFQIWAPVAQGEKGEFSKEFQKWFKKGFLRARVDGHWLELEKVKKLEKHKSHDIEILIDRLVVDKKYLVRLREAINISLGLTKGVVWIVPDGATPKIYSIHRACPECAYSFPEMEPRLFSFNNPRGACPTCHGMGIVGLDESDKSSADDSEEEEDQSSHDVCSDCNGMRIRKSSLNVFVADKNIAELSALSAEDLYKFFESIKLNSRDQMIAEKIIKQIQSRLDFMCRVGTAYLSLDRKTGTLSGGEAQRIRLATQVGSALIGVLYVLDEPSIGLHPRDHHRLLDLIRQLRDRGNTVILVEHDEDTIRAADYIIDLGPRAGRLGGAIVGRGSPKDIENAPKSLTGQYLSRKLSIPEPSQRRMGSGEYLELIGASGNNLQNVNLKIPLGTLCCITGVSGSGKSTLIIDTLYRVLAQKLNRSEVKPAAYEKIKGLEHIERVVQISQKPIGRTPRSTPSTYVGLMAVVRDLFAQLPESKIRGHKPGYFSFNMKGGRCESCEGGGQVKVAMHFLSDVFVNCDVCGTSRYNPEARSIRFKEKSIADVLQMSVEEALPFFKNHKVIYKKIDTLHRVGLDYLTLGQSSTTLSGGEAQRVKLAKELSKRGNSKTLYILDEPTTGLHFEDVKKLMELLQELVDQGSTVIVIEHNMDVVKCADHIIDMGPEGGKGGGLIVAEGRPEAIIENSQSETGKYLKDTMRQKRLKSKKSH